MKKKYDVALVVGTRPNFVKAAPLLKYFEENNLNTLFIHTGQHKDKNMSTDIFDDLSIRPPDIVLETPTVNMNEQLSYMLEALDGVFNENEIKMVGVFGDVTSTLAAALSAKNKKLELFHVEAGLRSRNMEMPEERNRIIVDSISDYLFAPSYDAVENLIDENIDEDKIFSVGNIMIDTLISNYEKIKSKTNKIKKNFDGNFKINFYLAPPIFYKKDKVTGNPLKIKFGQWLLIIFKILNKLKFLRGTLFDPFGYFAERKNERKLIKDYKNIILEIGKKI